RKVVRCRTLGRGLQMVLGAESHFIDISKAKRNGSHGKHTVGSKPSIIDSTVELNYSAVQRARKNSHPRFLRPKTFELWATASTVIAQERKQSFSSTAVSGRYF